MRDFDEYSNEDLCAAAKNGDNWAFGELVERHRGLIIHIVLSIKKKRKTPYLSFKDLLTEGEMGIYKGVNSFDPSRGSRFSSFIGNVIRNTIQDRITDDSRSEYQRGIDADWTLERYEQIDSYRKKYDPEHILVKQIHSREIRTAFLELSEREQELMWVKFGYHPFDLPEALSGWELSEKEIADICESKTSLIKDEVLDAFDHMQINLIGHTVSKEEDPEKEKERKEKALAHRQQIRGTIVIREGKNIFVRVPCEKDVCLAYQDKLCYKKGDHFLQAKLVRNDPHIEDEYTRND